MNFYEKAVQSIKYLVFNKDDKGTNAFGTEGFNNAVELVRNDISKFKTKATINKLTKMLDAQLEQIEVEHKFNYHVLGDNNLAEVVQKMKDASK